MPPSKSRCMVWGRQQLYLCARALYVHTNRLITEAVYACACQSQMSPSNCCRMVQRLKIKSRRGEISRKYGIPCTVELIVLAWMRCPHCCVHVTTQWYDKTYMTCYNKLNTWHVHCQHNYFGQMAITLKSNVGYSSVIQVPMYCAARPTLFSLLCTTRIGKGLPQCTFDKIAICSNLARFSA